MGRTQKAYKCNSLLRDRLGKRMLRWAWFILWIVSVSIPLAYASGTHLLPLPHMTISLPVPAAGTRAAQQWELTHVLAANCRCSQVIALHLERCGRLGNAVEHVWMIGRDPATSDALVARGYDVRTMEAEELAKRVGIEGIPWLIISDPLGRIGYCGGYSDRPLHAPDEPQDREILRRLMAGERVAPLPAFGCATAGAVQRMMDPLGLKYSARHDTRSDGLETEP